MDLSFQSLKFDIRSLVVLIEPNFTQVNLTFILSFDEYCLANYLP